MEERKTGRIILWILLGLAVLALTGVIVGMNLAERSLNTSGEKTAQTETESESETETESQTLGGVPKPEISEQLLTVNSYSRPGTKLEQVKYVVIHYLGNPETTAQQNHDYFESLKELQDTHMSANFIVGLDGEIIQCVPEDEVAYASNQENDESISIENCHIDETGELLSDTYFSLVKLTAYLVDKYDLTREQIIRHYDVTGKECPIYYVEHEDYWEIFRDDVMTYVELCQSYTVSDEELKKTLNGLAHTYSDRSEKVTEAETEETEWDDGESYGESYEEADEQSYEQSYESSYQDTGYYDTPQYQPPAYTPDTSTTVYTDTTTSDTGTSDTGTSDTGTGDAGTGDTSTSDTGTGDTGTGDTGTSDTGTGDTGTSDTGTTDDGSGTTADSTGTSDDGTSDDTSDGSAEAPVDAPVDE